MAEKINNAHNVYVLGAGFSAPRGFPVISNFMFALRDAHEWLSAQNRNWEAAAIERVLLFRREATPAAYRVDLDLEDIEVLFSLASVTGDAYSTDIRIAIAATLEYRRVTTPAPRSTFRTSPPKSHPQNARQWTSTYTVDDSGNAAMDTYDFLVNALLGRFANLDMEGRNTFVTLNYDTLVEESLSALGVPFSYGFQARHESRNGSDPIGSAAADPGVLVLKLHGSTNWFLSDTRGDSQRPPELEVIDSYDTLRARQIAPALVPPTWRKSISGQLQLVWDHALRELSEATRVIILGFSIPQTDLHFKYLLASALRENVSLREIVFVNISAEQLRPRLVSLFGDLDKRPVVRPVESTVSQFISPGMGPKTIYSLGRFFPDYIQLMSHGAY
jgi:SIR2-like domain